MKATLTPFLFASIFFFGKTSACNCIFIGDFCQTITYENNGEIIGYLNIYHARVTAKTNTGMKVGIFKTFHGEALEGQEIFITSGNGADCKIITDQFQVGQEMIIAAGKADSLWWLSDCGVSYLKVENGQVIGAIAPGVTEVALPEFASLANCGNLTSTGEPKPGYSIRIQPNLAHHKVSITTTASFTNDLALNVYDVTGRLVYHAVEKGFSASNALQVEVLNWSAGIYFFTINMAGKQEVFKVVKAGGN
ncbi:MAG: T9SS type A sorting domain-containing protein [Saprospiraceae bacterium]